MGETNSREMEKIDELISIIKDADDVSITSFYFLLQQIRQNNHLNEYNREALINWRKRLSSVEEVIHECQQSLKDIRE